MKNNVRQPRQERSIEKKNKIIDAGYQLFSEVGYYGTNKAEIAKRAAMVKAEQEKEYADIVLKEISEYGKEVGWTHKNKGWDDEM
jgi:phosphosulfolactate synthase (CoM biosynthesis protein A)